MKRILIIASILSLFLAFGGNTANAQNQPGESILRAGNLRDCIFGVEIAGKTPSEWAIRPGSCKIEQLFDLGNNVIQWGAGVSGALALLMYIIGGVWMIFSAGNSSRVERGKDIITGTTIALFFILGSWLIIDFSIRALRGEPYAQQLQTTTCDNPANDGKSCGDNSVCYKQGCVSECARLAGLANDSRDPLRVMSDGKFICQNPSNCRLTYEECHTGSFPFCKTGMCPGDESTVCCYNPVSRVN